MTSPKKYEDFIELQILDVKTVPQKANCYYVKEIYPCTLRKSKINYVTICDSVKIYKSYGVNEKVLMPKSEYCFIKYDGVTQYVNMSYENVKKLILG